MTFLYQKSRCLIEAFSLHLKHLLLFLPTTMYEGSYKCIISSLSISGSDTMSVNTSESVSVSMTVTFFETIDGAVNINGLTEAQ